jgi:hypothetical protein
VALPEVLWRFSAAEAIDSLARRFDLPNEPWMQDWEYLVADPQRIDEFLQAYVSGDLTEDEKFVLMEMLLQSFEDLEADLAADSRWHLVLDLLDRHISLHVYSIYYWSLLEDEDEDENNWWRITPFMRAILAKHQLS